MASIEVDGVLVDITALLSVSHTCDPLICRDRASCCSSYEICLSEKELPGVIGYLPAASKWVPGIRAGHAGDAEIDDENENKDRETSEIEIDNIFDEEESDVIVIDADDRGECRLAYRGDQNQLLCALHTAALSKKLSFYKTKPTACLLWPLAMNSEGQPHLSVQPDAFEFPCNQINQSDTLDDGVAEIIEGVFGSSFLEKIRSYIDCCV